jgi:hypothetical protein
MLMRPEIRYIVHCRKLEDLSLQVGRQDGVACDYLPDHWWCSENRSRRHAGESSKHLVYLDNRTLSSVLKLRHRSLPFLESSSLLVSRKFVWTGDDGQGLLVSFKRVEAVLLAGSAASSSSALLRFTIYKALHRDWDPKAEQVT